MPGNVELITNALVAATREGLTVLVVDSSFDLVRQLCSRIYAMDRGVLTGVDRPAEFASPDELAATYLGEARARARGQTRGQSSGRTHPACWRHDG